MIRKLLSLVLASFLLFPAMGYSADVRPSGTAVLGNPVDTTHGGTGQDFSASTGFIFDTVGTMSAIGCTTGIMQGGAPPACSTTPALGTPASGVATNLTGTAASLTAGNVTTNANLTGVITSVGNATSIASQTGTGTKFVVDNTPTLITPAIGAATGVSLTLTGSLVIADSQSVGATAAGVGPKFTFRTSGNDSTGDIQLIANNANSSTTNTRPHVGIVQTFSPASGSQSYTTAEIRPTCNGTSTGTCYGLGVAMVATAMTGGTMRPFSVGTTSSTLFSGYTEKFGVDTAGTIVATGHIHTSTTAPAVTNTSANSCGTSAATIAGTDVAGKVTVGATSGTSCTVTFTTTWTNAPACVVTNETTANLSRATSTTTTVILAGTFVGGDVLSYLCLGRV